jgi:hypothetical protein
LATAVALGANYPAADAWGASSGKQYRYRSANFVVHATTAEIARTVGAAAEKNRRDLAVTWLGAELPTWSSQCPVIVEDGRMVPGGETTFTFGAGEVSGWRMRVQGSLDQIIDSVLPHEISHAVLASYFRRPLPRWADEGAAVLSEDPAERYRQQLRVEQLFRRQQPMPLKQLLAIQEYPQNPQSTAALYAQGYLLCDFLVQNSGKTAYIVFLKDAQKRGWDVALLHSYGYESVDVLEQSWNQWVRSGCQPLAQARVPATTTTPPIIASAPTPTEAATQAVTQVRVASQPTARVPAILPSQSTAGEANR